MLWLVILQKNANTLADFLTVNPNILDEYIQEHSEQIKAHLSSLNNYIQNKAQIIECFKDEYILKKIYYGLHKYGSTLSNTQQIVT